MPKGWRTFCVVLLFLGPATGAGIDVGYDESIDFSRYRTFMWRAGTPAARPRVQVMIVQAIERQLRNAGFERIDEGRPDVYVTSTAFTESGASRHGAFYQSAGGGLALIRSELRDFRVGTLLVEIRDAGNDALVWQAAVTEPVTNIDTPAKAERKIDKVTGKMFRKFPPGSRE